MNLFSVLKSFNELDEFDREFILKTLDEEFVFTEEAIRERILSASLAENRRNIAAVFALLSQGFNDEQIVKFIFEHIAIVEKELPVLDFDDRYNCVASVKIGYYHFIIYFRRHGQENDFHGCYFKNCSHYIEIAQ